MAKTDSNHRPTHYAFVVRKNGDKSYWTRIGVAWANQDGKGFNIKLSLLPIDGADIVLREAKDEGDPN